MAVEELVSAGYVFGFLMLVGCVVADVSRVLARVDRVRGGGLFVLAGLGGLAIVCAGGLLVPGGWRFLAAWLAAGLLAGRALGGSARGCLVASLAGLLALLGVGSGFVGVDPRGGWLLSVGVPLCLGLALLLAGFGCGLLCCRGLEGLRGAVGMVARAGCFVAGGAVFSLLVLYVAGSTVYRGLVPGGGLLYSSLLGVLGLGLYSPASLPLALLLLVVCWASPFMGLAPGLLSGWSLAVLGPFLACGLVLWCLRGHVLGAGGGCLAAAVLGVAGCWEPLLACLAPVAGFAGRVGARGVPLLVVGLLLLYALYGWVPVRVEACLGVEGLGGWGRPPVAAAGAPAAHSLFMFYPAIVDLGFARALALDLANVSGTVNKTLYYRLFGELVYLHEAARKRGLLVNVSGPAGGGGVYLPGTRSLPRLRVCGGGVCGLLDTGWLMLCEPPSDVLLRFSGGWLCVGLDCMVLNSSWVNVSDAWRVVYGFLASGGLGNHSLLHLVYYALNHAYCVLRKASNATVDRLPFDVAVAFIAYALNASDGCVHARLTGYRLPGGLAVVYGLALACPVAGLVCPLELRRRGGGRGVGGV